MTDRELLELAAKAAGLKPPMPMHGPGLTWGHGWWNPLVDSGEALELAVKLEIDVDFYLADVQATRDGFNPVFELFSEHNDRTATTRRAIVRAAAKIGRSKE